MIPMDKGAEGFGVPCHDAVHEFFIACLTHKTIPRLDWFGPFSIRTQSVKGSRGMVENCCAAD